MHEVVEQLLRASPRWGAAVENAEPLATAVTKRVDELDAEIEQAADNWRLARIGAIEQGILRLSLYELLSGTVPPRVAISEGVRLAQWFAGSKAPSFVNGVLDAVARRAGRL
jgi:N utilization substance protein B